MHFDCGSRRETAGSPPENVRPNDRDDVFDLCTPEDGRNDAPIDLMTPASSSPQEPAAVTAHQNEAVGISAASVNRIRQPDFGGSSGGGDGFPTPALHFQRQANAVTTQKGETIDLSGDTPPQNIHPGGMLSAFPQPHFGGNDGSNGKVSLVALLVVALLVCLPTDALSFSLTTTYFFVSCATPQGQSYCECEEGSYGKTYFLE